MIFLNLIKFELTKFKTTGNGLNALEIIKSDFKFFWLKISFLKTSTFKSKFSATSFRNLL